MVDASIPVAAKLATGGLKVVSRFWDVVARKKEELRNADSLRAAMGIGKSDEYSYRVATNHPLFDWGDPHPDDFEAFASVLGGDVAAWDKARSSATADDLTGQLDNGFVLIGSPEAEAVTRLAFGYVRLPSSAGMQYVANGLNLPFRWEEDSRVVRAQYRKFVPGRGSVSRPNWPILDQRREGIRSLYPVLDASGLLKSDLLLCTKVPNFLSLEGLQSGRSIVSIAGSHGTATRAIELILKNNGMLNEVHRELQGNHASFQVLFDISNIVHDEKKGSIAQRAEIRAVEPIDLPDRTLLRLNKEVGERKDAWIEEVSNPVHGA